MATETSFREPQSTLHDEVVESQPDKTRSASLIELLIVFAERKRTVLKVAAGCTVAALALAFLLPVRYTATAVLLPPQQNQSLGSTIAAQLSGLGGLASLAGGMGGGSLAGSLGLKNPNDMYVAMLKGRTVEEAMVREFGLMHEYHARNMIDARKDFERHIDVDGSGKDGLIHISVSDHDPRRAAAMANQYVDRFRDLSEHLAITEASQRRVFFEQQLEQAKEKLAAAEEALKATEQKTGMIQIDSQARALIETAARVRAQVAAQEVQIQAMQTYANGNNAQLVEAQQELDALRAQLAKLGGSETDPNQLIVPKGLVPQAGLEYVRRVRDVKYNETIFEILAREYEVAKLDEAKEGSLIQVVDAAVPPDKRSFPPRILIICGGIFLGLVFGCLFALWAETLAQMQAEPLGQMRLTRLKRALSWKAQSLP